MQFLTANTTGENKRPSRKNRKIIIRNSSTGYIALTSALIISAVIIAIVIVLGQASFLGRQNIANTHFKEKSRALAEACAQTALLKIVASPAYAGNETINVASDTCKIVSVVNNGSNRVISVQAQYQKSYTNYKVTIPTSTVSILGLEEAQNF